MPCPKIILGRVLRSIYIFEVTIENNDIIIVHADSYEEANRLTTASGYTPFRIIQRS